MKKNYSGYLLLEGMVAMFVVAISVMFMLSTITFLLTKEKKTQMELETAILLFEMGASVRTFDLNQEAISEKAANLDIQIIEWQENHLRIEGDSVSFDVIRN